MKRLAYIMLVIAMFLASCGYETAAYRNDDLPLAENNTDTAGKKSENDDRNVYVMSVMSDYQQIYERLKEIKESYDYFVVDEMAVAEAVEMEAPLYSASADAFVSEIQDAPDASVKSEDYSKTNTQLEDVDEGDIVKTDGKYIYLLKDNAYLCIISAAGENSALISKTLLELTDNTNAHELYLSENKVAVVSEQRKSYQSYKWYPSNYYTTITIYDVSSPEHPVMISRTGQDGSYTASRMVNDDIYLITRHDIIDYADFTVEEYGEYIPSLYENGIERLIAPGCIVCPQQIRQSCYTVVSRYDAQNGNIDVNKTILGIGNTVYMNQDHLYLADEYYFSDESEPYEDGVYTVVDYESGTRTEIFCFDLENNLKTKAVGTVEGSLLNQFAMDEYNSCLRVVTTSNNSSYSVYTDPKYGFTNYQWHDSGRTTGLYVFDENMEIIGKVEGLAKNERVYSVRFSGDTAYFVTFRTVDPLFTADLSDPENPVILSELKIPGFSNYLHPYSKGLLFGLGQDADENTGRTRGMKLSMFDVSDPHAVAEKHCLKLEYEYSDAFYNHKAILISAENDLIGFPTEIGYAIYGYSADKGFYKKAETELEKMWSSQNIRGLYAGDYVYIVTQDFTAVLLMRDLSLKASIEY